MHFKHGQISYLWLVGNGGMVVMVLEIVPIPPFPTNQRTDLGYCSRSGKEGDLEGCRLEPRPDWTIEQLLGFRVFMGFRA